MTVERDKEHEATAQAQRDALAEQEAKLTATHDAEIQRLTNLLQKSQTELIRARVEHKHETTAATERHQRKFDRLNEQLQTMANQCTATTTKFEALQTQWKDANTKLHHLDMQLVKQGNLQAKLEIMERHTGTLEERLADYDQLRETNAELNGQLKQLRRQLAKAEKKR